uniref:Uncharacterized protein n=1 Tax=Sinocyclocheilus grahami TaxID=75366 RepID=A0A672RX92_SINGR
MIADVDVAVCVLEPEVRMRGTPMDPGDPSLLFDDTSAGGNRHEHSGVGQGPDVYPGQALLSHPMSNLAMAYGSSLASHGKEMMDKNVRHASPHQVLSLSADVCVFAVLQKSTPVLFSSRAAAGLIRVSEQKNAPNEGL